MKPIGLTTKADGEIMVIHLCLNCGKISINRIAGDDNAYSITVLLEESDKLIKDSNHYNLKGINLLTLKDKAEVIIALYGYGYKKYLR